MTALRTKTNVQRSTADTNRRADMGMVSMRNSTRSQGPTVGQQTTVGALTDRDVAERFANAVVGFTTAQLAAAARCTKEGAKHWKDASRCPSLPKALEMGRSMPVVRDWILAEMGVSPAANAQMMALREIVAAEVREMVKKPAAPSAEPDEDRRAFVVRDLFERRRA